MTKDVLLRITGLHSPDSTSEEDATELVTTAVYFQKGDDHYIKFKEVPADGGDITQSLLKLKDNRLELIRKGATHVHMVFEENRKSVTYYDTPFGRILMGISTTLIAVIPMEDRMEIIVSYELELSQDYLADCTLTIEVLFMKEETHLLS